jgi:hypothetical protein
MADAEEVPAISISFVIYDATTGIVRAALSAVHHDGDTVIANNTPEGCAALVVDGSNPVMVSQKGWVVTNGVLAQVPPSPAELLASAQTIQSATIESSYQDAIYNQPISYMDTTFWTDQNSQSMLMGAVVGFQMDGGVPAGFSWWDSTSTAIPMTLAQLQGLYQAILGRFNACFVKRKTLLAQIEAATTVAAVEAIVW